jgi:hypothetical protein
MPELSKNSKDITLHKQIYDNTEAFSRGKNSVL